MGLKPRRRGSARKQCWLHEVKHDRYRMLARIEHGRTGLINRSCDLSLPRRAALLFRHSAWRSAPMRATLAFGLGLGACSSVGPSSVPRDRVSYSNALSDSWKDQILLNIVRLRYADTPTFMDVSSIISAYTIQAAAQASGTANFGTPSNATNLPQGTGSVTIGGVYNDRPTISYTPLTGRKFAQSLLTPIPPNAIFSLIAAGYPADLVLPVTVRALNAVYNRAAQGGVRRPSDPQFYPLVEALRRIQLSRAFSMRVEKRDDTEVAIGTLISRPDPGLQRDIAFIKETLGLSAENGEVLLTHGASATKPNELAVLSRSMIEILNEIAADLDAPAEDVVTGRTYANAELDPDGPRFDLPHVKIQSGQVPPDRLFSAVQYRGTWYWISDNDFASKRGLTFLLLFFSLAETGAAPEAPVLTIPVQ